MKGTDIFCASQASTAICSSVVDHRSMVRHGHRRIDRQSSKPYAPCNSSQLPIIPRPYHEKSRKNSVKPSDVKSSPGSSTCLLSDRPFIDWLPESDRVSPSIHPSQPAKPKLHESSNNNSSPALKSSSSARSHNQVVVLWVSIHCKGCEGKLRKHISKMEGVTSFSIDLPCAISIFSNGENGLLIQKIEKRNRIVLIISINPLHVAFVFF
ncbi:protein SODIUM POTASSIUM ROOT DEFECTIVE 3-like [Hibiscus syriacus]|uniref:protein SODIUM POTASSIUM ROOT DEFECTIVE 3-like n=1 Tax=Hibiscus syriacus TaxID=106335 RepID=UPI00192311B7|nr:protein SODIUM POTASSIUM ROOT DEFECTIVE 3-like [Hibiscus syriacus]